eukprot:g9366.t1
MDCCSRGTFECDDAWDQKAHAGLVLQARDQYRLAVRQAAAAYGLASAKEPIFVQWVVDPEKVELNYWMLGNGILVGSCLISLVISGVLNVILLRVSESAARTFWISGTDGGWPFEGILGEVPKVQPLPHGLPHGLPHAFPGAFPFGRAPVIVVEHHSLLDMFGDHHAGHHGLAQGSFEVHDDHQSRVLISAVLPGYEFGTKTSEKPLSVRAVGRSLVISGTHHQGPLISQWQRVFSVPKGCDVKNVSVTYNSGSGNLTVVIPRSNTTSKRALTPLLRGIWGAMAASLHGDVASAIGKQVEQMILQAKKDSEQRVRHELNVARTQLQQMEELVFKLARSEMHKRQHMCWQTIVQFLVG